MAALRPKSNTELAIMRQGGAMLGELFTKIKAMIAPGITPKELDAFAYDFIIKHNSKPSFKGYKVGGGVKYPATICASVNEVVIHGIPGKVPLKDGDIIGIDIGLCFRGYHVDSAETYAVGKISPAARKLIDTTEAAFFAGMKALHGGVHLGDMSHAIQTTVEREGYSVVRQFAGHGIGSHLHEDPQVSNYGKPGHGPVLAAGVTIAVEPMVNMGHHEVIMLDDDWTIVTDDGSLSSHYEHTVAVTDDGYELLTNR
ncbi:MAG: type I methionyl aminopeptidase [Spirochaetes bacterium]|nr:type I methionyl aminopeptidase [Spirochaetota bacterium]